MKKKNYSRIIFILASVILLFFAEWQSMNAERQKAEEEKQAWLQERLYADTLTFVPGLEGGGRTDAVSVTGWHDWTGGRMYVFLPSYAAGLPLELNWRFADRLLIDGEEWENGQSFDSYELNREYVFEFWDDGTMQEAWTVVLLCSQNLPAVFIDTDSGSMETVDADKENREEGFFCLVDTDGSVACMDQLTYVKGRGNTTWGQDKKPYSVKLANAHDILGMGAARRFELLANAYDGSHMRNHLIFKLAQDAGMNFTPQAAWVDLYLNGEYQGVYQITEKVEVAENRVDIANQENGQGDLTGGYLFVMEDYSRFEAAQYRFQTGGQSFVINSPDPASEEQVSWIKGFVQEFEDAVTAPDGINPETGKHFTEYIDLTSFAKKYLVEEIAKNSDAVTNSQYFYKQPDSMGGLLYAGPVWDYDNALGHTNEEAMDPSGLMLDKIRSDDGTSNLWYAALCSQPVFMERVKTLYADVFSGLLDEIAEEEIGAWREQLRVAATLDWIRWKDTDKSFRYKVCDSFDEYVAYLQEFVRDRKEFLDSVYIKGEEYVKIRFVRGKVFGFVDLYTKAGDVGRQPPDSSDIEWEGEHITGWFYEDGTAYDPNRTVEKDVTVYAGWEAAEQEGEGNG